MTEAFPQGEPERTQYRLRVTLSDERLIQALQNLSQNPGRQPSFLHLFSEINFIRKGSEKDLRVASEEYRRMLSRVMDIRGKGTMFAVDSPPRFQENGREGLQRKLKTLLPVALGTEVSRMVVSRELFGIESETPPQLDFGVVSPNPVNRNEFSGVAEEIYDVLSSQEKVAVGGLYLHASPQFRRRQPALNSHLGEVVDARDRFGRERGNGGGLPAA